MKPVTDRIALNLQAYDSHCNLVLGEVEETIYTIDEDEEGDDAVRVRVYSQGLGPALMTSRPRRNSQICCLSEVR